MSVFGSANILLPKGELIHKWPVIACDQYTSQPEYWEAVRNYVGQAPSALHMILPEAELGSDNQAAMERAHKAMAEYAASDILQTYENAFVYVERTLSNGMVRCGIVGVVDLECYDYGMDRKPLVRATEKTVVERIPPRRAVRQGACLDMSHVLMLADDREDILMGPLTKHKDQLPLLYSMELMAGGGHIAGWLVAGEAARALSERIEAYEGAMKEKFPAGQGGEMVYVVGDGNHSLAAAKDCYEMAKNIPGTQRRYALVELENIHHAAQQFEPIHRLVEVAEPETLLRMLEENYCAPDGYPVAWCMDDRQGVLYLDRGRGGLDLAVLQPALDAYVQEHGGSIDYIHGEDTLRELVNQKKALGFFLAPIAKGDFFRNVVTDGVLPRKTFSMGHANEKRYYLETRRL